MSQYAEVIEAPEPPPVDPGSEGSFLIVKLDDLRESPTNPRRRFDPEKLQELAASIITHGVLEPILVRTAFKDIRGRAGQPSYEIIAGARRFRAARLAGFTSVPVIFREMNDQTALEAQIIENSNRQDVHPLEEAEGFQSLIDLHRYTPQRIAEKIGKSDSYVQRRLKLASLIPDAKEAFFDGRLSLEHCLSLARLEPSSQGKALPKAWRQDWSKNQTKDGSYPPNYAAPLTAREFDDLIRAKFFLSLHSTPWDKTDAKLYPAAGACATCQKRTGASPMLFDEAEKGDNCLDSECFGKKRELHLVQVEKAAKKAGASLIRVATSYISDKDAQQKKIVRSHEYEKVSKSNRCDHTQRAVVVIGESAGAQLDICTNKRCKQHLGKPYISGSNRAVSPEEKKRRSEAEQKRAAVEAVTQAIMKGILSKIPTKMGSREWTVLARELSNAGNLVEVVELAEMDPLPGNWQAQKNAFTARIAASSEQEAAKALIAICLRQMAEDCYEAIEGDLVTTAKEYGLDPKAIEKQVTAAVLAKYKAAEPDKPTTVPVAKKKTTPHVPKVADNTKGEICICTKKQAAQRDNPYCKYPHKGERP